MDNDFLEERLYSIRNLVDMTLLAIKADRQTLIYTGLEEICYKTQGLIDEYCIKRDENIMPFPADNCDERKEG